MFKKGQRVFDIRFGWGTVLKVYKENGYPVQVSYQGNKKAYTLDGLYNTSDKGRSLFFAEPEITLSMSSPPW